MSTLDDFGIHIPFGELLGIRKLAETPGSVTVGLAVRSDLMNSWHVAHGGAVMSLLDATMGMSAKSLDPDSNGATTVELKVNFLASATGDLVAQGHAQRAGRSLVFVEGEVRNAQGDVLAKATGTFKLRHPAGSRTTP
jgi:uncharacterized protein (TIGR00369 family)